MKRISINGAIVRDPFRNPFPSSDPSRHAIWTMLVERDIEVDDDLLRRYLERIPVIALDGTELFDYFVDEQALRAALSSVAP